MLKIDLTPIKEFRYCQISNHNFNFLLLNEKNKALHSPFVCKDYIQDIFYTEYTGKSEEIYGIMWQKGMLNTDVSTFKLAILGTTEEMQERAEDLQAFLNLFEVAQNIPPCKIVKTNDSKNIVIEFSKEWTVNGPLLSAFTTLIRLGGVYKKGEDAVKYLKSLLQYANKMEKVPLPNYMLVDVNRLNMCIKRLAALLQGKRVEHKWEDFQSINQVHHTGLIGYKNFPEVEI